MLSPEPCNKLENPETQANPNPKGPESTVIMYFLISKNLSLNLRSLLHGPYDDCMRNSHID